MICHKCHDLRGYPDYQKDYECDACHATGEVAPDEGEWFVVSETERPEAKIPDDDMVWPHDRTRLWTLSKDPNEAGWNTDGGYSGYGLSYADACWLRDVANAAIKAKQ